MHEFGRYAVERHLARGGMAELYLVRPSPDRLQPRPEQCVVKQLAPRLATDQAFRNMFIDEARVSRRLRHPNIPRVFDAGMAPNGSPYYVMEYLDGIDLAELRRRLRRRGARLSMASAVSIVLQVCRALAYAHELRDHHGAPLHIVHRDVSPANVFITTTGVVKLIDFGIARTNDQMDRTRAGVLKGKLRYMSPEQALARPIDRRSDVFSASVLLWELTVGRRLFAQDSDLAVLRAIVETDAPAPSNLIGQYAPELDYIVHTGLQRRAENRFQTAEDMANALAVFAAQQRLDVSSDALLLDLYPILTDAPRTTSTPAPEAQDEPSYEALEIGVAPTQCEAPAQPVINLMTAALCVVGLIVGLLVAVAASS